MQTTYQSPASVTQRISPTLLLGTLGVLILLALLSLPAAPSRSPSLGSEPSAAQARVQTLLGKLPLYFVENRGPGDERGAYYVQGKDTTLYFTAEGVTFVLSPRGQADSPGARASRPL